MTALRPPLLLATTVATAALLQGCGTPGPAPLREVKTGCAALAGSSIAASAIGIPSGVATLVSATLVAASPLSTVERGPTPAATITPAAPEYCKVLGHIAPLDPKAPLINFQINLPVAWNGRSVQYGGGGFNGVLITALGLVPAAPFDKASPLARGFVTVGTDSGHQNEAGKPPQTFALNDEALINFSHASYKKVRDVAVAVMKQAYGRAPQKLYFVGSSEGGREGLTMAQRYPADFNGIFSRVPVIHWTGLQFAGTRNGIASMGENWLRPAQVKLVHDAVLATCDELDGVKDGIVSDAVACKARFDVSPLRCLPRQHPDTCLTDGQVAAVRTLHSPYRFASPLANGLTEYPGWGVGGENTTSYGPTGGWSAWWLGSSAPAQPPAPSNGIAWFYGSGALQYFYARNPAVDPRTITPENTAARVREVSALMDATDPNLHAFANHGGRLIVLENMADYAQSPYAGIQYVESVVKTMGASKTADFLRLFTAPGVDHVGSGAPGNVDMLDALVEWVERGKAPNGLELQEQSHKPPFATMRARPLCPWPMVPRYQGGDANAASSFRCLP